MVFQTDSHMMLIPITVYLHFQEKAVDAVPYIGVLLESDDCKVRMPSEVVDLVYWLLKDKPFQMKFCDKDIVS